MARPSAAAAARPYFAENPERKIILQTPFANNSQVFARPTHFADPSLMDGGNVFAQKKNYLEARPPQAEADARDVEYSLRINSIAEEISAIATQAPIGAALEALSEEALRESLEEKSRLILGTLLAAISPFVGDLIDAEHGEWEARLRKNISEKIINGHDTIVAFSEALYRAVLYSTRNKNMEPHTDEERRDNFQQIKSAADLQDCVGGAIAALETIHNNLKDPGNLWNLVKARLVQDLISHSLPGNQAHLSSWLEFAFHGNLGRDEMLFAVASDMTMENVRRVLETLTLRSGNILADVISKYILDIIYDSKMQAVKMQEPVQPDQENYNSYLFLEIAQKMLRNSPYPIIKDIEMFLINAALDDDITPTKEEKFLVIKNHINSLLNQSKDDFQEKKYDLQKDETKNLIRLILEINTYTAKNMPIPIWLSRTALRALRIECDAENPDPAIQDNLEIILTEKLEEVAQEISRDLNINLKLLKIQNQEQQQTTEPTVKCWRPGGATFIEKFQRLLDSGDSIDNFITALKDPRMAEISDNVWSISGLLFHPQYRNIMVTLRKNQLFLLATYEALERAIILGDFYFMANADVLFTDIVAAWLPTETELSERPMPRMTLAHLDLFFQSLKATIPEDVLRRNFWSMLIGTFYEDIDNYTETPTILYFIENSNNKLEILTWIYDNLGHQIFTDFISGELDIKQVALWAASDHSNKIFNLLDTVYADSSEDERVQMGGLNHQLALAYNNIDPHKSLQLAYRAAQDGHLKAQIHLGELFLNGKPPIQSNQSESFIWLLAAYDQECSDKDRAIIAYNLCYLHYNDNLDFIANFTEAKRFCEESLAIFTNLHQVNNDERTLSSIQNLTMTLGEINESIAFEQNPAGSVEQEEASALSNSAQDHIDSRH